MVALMIKNEALANEIDKLQKIGEESKAEKQYVKLLKQKNIQEAKASIEQVSDVEETNILGVHCIWSCCYSEGSWGDIVVIYSVFVK